MKYYKLIVNVPDMNGISKQKRKDGTFVVYKYTEHVTEPEEKDVVRTCTIGRMPWERIPQMYPNDNYRKLFPEYEKLLTDEMAFPDEYCIQPGLFVFLKRCAENCGLQDMLRTCFEDEDAVNEILDLAIYLASTVAHRSDLDEYLDNAPLMTDDWYDSEDMRKSIRKKMQIRQIRDFVKKWAAKHEQDDGKKPDMYLYLDTSFWGKLFGGRFSLHGTEARLKPDVEGPKGVLPPLNYILALRCPDGMPLFYKDTGFDASVDIYGAGADLARKHHAKSFTFLLKDPDATDEEIAKLDAAGYDYFFRVLDNPDMCAECFNTANEEELFYESVEGENHEYVVAYGYIREPFNLCAEMEITYGSRKGWIYVYDNLNDAPKEEAAVDEDVRWSKDRAEKCIGKTRAELEKAGYNPDSIKYCSFTWGKKRGKEVVLSYELDNETVERDKYIAGVTCYFSTREGMAQYALAFVDDAGDYSSIIESNGLNTRDFMKQLSSDEEPETDCWKDKNNEIESFIKFVACILIHTLQKVAEASGLTESYNDSMLSVYSVLNELDMIFATRGKRGRFHLDHPLDYVQTELFKAIGMTPEDFLEEMEKAGEDYVRRTSPW